METNTDFVSAVATVKAPDGSDFDILRNAPEGAAQIRGNALVEMRTIAQREPKLLDYLKTGSGTSSEYAMSSAVMHSQDRGVKTDLTRVYVNWGLAEGHRSSAVDHLAYANASELDLPEFSEPVVASWFAKDVEEGNWHDAWFMAGKVLREEKKIFKEMAPETRKTWENGEREAFQHYAEQVIEDAKTSEPGSFNWELDGLFDECRFRADGYSSETPSKVAMQIAEIKVRNELGKKNGAERALFFLADTGLGEDFVRNIQKEVKVESAQKAKEAVIRRAKNILSKATSFFRQQ